MSLLAVTDGKDHALLETAQDHKQLLDGDRGPNTGGMGVYSPYRSLDDAVVLRIREEIIEPRSAASARRTSRTAASSTPA